MTISREKESKMKKNVFLGNAFSVQMLNFSNGEVPVRFTKISLDKAKEILSSGFTSAIGHNDTAAVVSGLLGMNVPSNRISISLEKGKDTLIIAQIMGGRLPEGSTTIPEGMKIEFIEVEI